jgi:hypothetical protein
LHSSPAQLAHSRTPFHQHYCTCLPLSNTTFYEPFRNATPDAAL